MVYHFTCDSPHFQRGVVSFTVSMVHDEGIQNAKGGYQDGTGVEDRARHRMTCQVEAEDTEDIGNRGLHSLLQ